jgi:CheY-like chemotaxis protein
VTHRLRAIVTEDDVLVRMTVAAMLADLGFDVVEAESGRQAIAALAATADLLMVDLRLPDMSGFDVAEQALALDPGIRVIVASGEPAPDTTTHIWLEKPFNAARLRAALEAAIGDRWPATRS